LRVSVGFRSAIAVLAVLAVVGLLVYGLASHGSSRVQIGEAAPDPTLPKLEGGGESSLGEHRGEWVLVNFWASWCGPCKDEAPALEQFQRQHGGEGFTVLGIDTRDLSGDGKSFTRKHELSYPQLRDGDGGVAHEYGTTGVPENFLVDPRGKVRWLTAGPVTEGMLDGEIAPIIEGKS
jgi:cytochrome c biogenesis protein CcmG, thiol:disulfide interchange protein DsbE